MMKKTVKYFVAKDEGDDDVELICTDYAMKAEEFRNEGDAITFAKLAAVDNP